MRKRKLTVEQLDELQSGDGVYYITQETALCPGISGEWPSVVPHPTNKNGRLVKRQVPEDVCEYCGEEECGCIDCEDSPTPS